MSQSSQKGTPSWKHAAIGRHLRRGLVGYRTADVERLFAAASACAEAGRVQREDSLGRLRQRVADYRRREADRTQAIEIQRRHARDTEGAVVEYELAAWLHVEEARQRFERQEAELLATLERVRRLLEARRALLLLRPSFEGRAEETDPMAGPLTAERRSAGEAPDPAVPPAPVSPQPAANPAGPPLLRRREA